MALLSVDKSKVIPKKKEPVQGGYVFPVAGGKYSFSNDWGQPRSGGRTHEGIDIFAAYGTPVVAVADGKVKLYTTPLGGLSARVYDNKGNSYYYTHLSQVISDGAASRNGVTINIKKGEVIGYVGTSGNAKGTSPHLHFQYHPGDGRASEEVFSWLSGLSKGQQPSMGATADATFGGPRGTAGQSITYKQYADSLGIAITDQETQWLLSGGYSDGQIRSIIKQWADTRNAGDIAQARAELEERLINLYQQVAGISPNASTLAWLQNKAESGANTLSLTQMIQTTPEMQKRFPGIPTDWTADDFDQFRQSADETFLKNFGRPVTDKEVQQIFKGKIPNLPFLKEA